MAQTFNPIKQDEDGKKAHRVIWSTQSIEMAIKGLSQGRRLLANPFYENDTRLLKSELTFQRTPEEIEEWLKCKNDIIYFVEKYCKLMTPVGIRNVELRPYQKKYLHHVMENQLSIYLAVRQCGKTTSTAVALLHYICFNVDKNAMVCGNKRKTAIEILDKIKKIFYELPYFLKPGVYKWNEAEIALDNGCRVQGEATTTNSGIGQTIHWLILDEFAHIQKNIAEPFYNNIFPTVTAAKAKCTITSTQNGRNLFYRIYKAAEEGVSDYKPFKTDWWEVPEWDADKKCFVPRDEEWYQKQIANFGSLQAFNSQFGCDFDIGNDSLIDNAFLKKLKTKVFENIEEGNFINKVSKSYYFDLPFLGDLGITKLKNIPIIITIDLSEGIGKDYTCFAIHTIEKDSTIRLIGYFRDNQTPRPQQAESLLQFCQYLDPNKSLISIEYNTYGELFYQNLLKWTEEDPRFLEFDRNMIVKYYKDDNSKNWVPGIRLNSRNKPMVCNLFKESYELKKYVGEDERLITELGNFIKNENNDSYAASFGHDDLVMACIQTEFVKNTTQYKMLVNQLDAIYDSSSGNNDNNVSSIYDFGDDFNITMAYNNNYLY